jgi:hypothetical protein
MCSCQEVDGAALHVDQSEISGGGEGLVEELAGPLGVAGVLPREEHPGPLDKGATEMGGRPDLLVDRGRITEMALGLGVAAQDSGQS